MSVCDFIVLHWVFFLIIYVELVVIVIHVDFIVELFRLVIMGQLGSELIILVVLLSKIFIGGLLRGIC